MNAKVENYNVEMTNTIVEGYKAGQTVEALAALVGRSTRSVIAKLSREGIYVAKQRAPGAVKTTKADLIAKIAEKYGVTEVDLESLEKATKAALEILAA